MQRGNTIKVLIQYIVDIDVSHMSETNEVHVEALDKLKALCRMSRNPCGYDMPGLEMYLEGEPGYQSRTNST